MDKIESVDIKKIHDFPNHPFKIIEDQNYKELKESITNNGVLIPVILRKKNDDEYEMISGHRRKKISDELGIKEIPSIIKDLSDEEATIIMVDSNLQREKILPSEKAFAYKMKYEAMKNQGVRNDLTSTPVEQKLSIEELSEQVGESREQIRRYIRLTELIPELLNLVDDTVLKDKRAAITMGIRPAVELSYLSADDQHKVYQEITYQDATPSFVQSKRIRELSETNKLDSKKLESIFLEEKPNQEKRISFNERRIKEALPKDLKDYRIEDYIIKAIQSYSKNNDKERGDTHEVDI